MDPQIAEAVTKVQNAIEHLKKDLSSIRAGRANPSLIEDISVEAYGERMKLLEVGTIAVPQSSLLTIQVWDQSVVKAVEKAISEANLGINPSVDGNVVRLAIPPLTQERREEFAKMSHQKGESSRIEIRQIRQDTRDSWKALQESGEISEDELFRREKLLQDVLDKTNFQIDQLVKEKQEELIQI